MKRIICATFLILFSFSANAENWQKFPSHAVESIINTRVSPDRRVAAADEYQKNMDARGRISVTGLYKVCIAAGANIEKVDGYEWCKSFLSDIVSRSMSGVWAVTAKSCADVLNGVWTLDDAGQYRCVGRDGYVLNYKKSCDGGDGKCIKDFDELQTQEPKGREFIDAWGQQKGLQLTCHSDVDERRTIISPLGQDYIMCSAKGVAYEFEFDDLNQDPDQTAVDSENKAMCELFYGTVVDSDDDKYTFCDVARDMCDGPLRELAMATAHAVMYQGNCRISREVKETFNIHLRTIDGISSREFYFPDTQLRVGDAVKMVEEYLRVKFPNETYIKCDGKNIRILNDSLVGNRDHVMTCTVGTQKIDFVFEDLTEGLAAATKAGLSTIECKINGGKHDGKHCRWLTKSQCDDLNKAHPNTARWDDGAEACVMLNAEKYNDVRDATFFVGGVVVTVASVAISGGTSALVYVAAVGADVLFEGAFQGYERWTEVNPQHRASQFIEETHDCKDPVCAAAAIKDYTVRLNEILDDLDTDMQDKVMSHFDYLSSLISDDEFMAAMNKSDLKIEDRVYNASSWALALLMLFGNPDQAISKGIQKAPRYAQKLGRWADAVTNAPRGDNLGDMLYNLLGRKAYFRSGKLNTLGHDYYRVFINNTDEGLYVIDAVQRQGLYAIPHSTKDGQMYIAVAKKNIFEPWENSSSNWLRGTVKDAGNVAKVRHAGDYVSSSAQVYHKQLSESSIWTNKSNYWLQRSTGAGDSYPWKMHIYADSYEDFEQISKVVIPTLLNNNTTFKTFAYTQEGIDNVLSTSSSQFGKAFTLYVENEAEFKRVAIDLNSAIKRAGLHKSGGSILGENVLDDTGRIFYRAERYDKNGVLEYISAEKAREIAPNNPYNPFNMYDPFKNLFR